MRIALFIFSGTGGVNENDTTRRNVELESISYRDTSHWLRILIADITDSDPCHGDSILDDSSSLFVACPASQGKLDGLRKIGGNAVDGGGFSDIWRGVLGDGTLVALKVIRTFEKNRMVGEV